MNKSQKNLSLFFVPISLMLATIGNLMVMILILNHGHFMYTLDDPYIHLSLSENIKNGIYGINSGEYSSPSSSILWPFLLAPFSGYSIQEYIPLIVNIIVSIGIVYLIKDIIVQSIGPFLTDNEKVLSIWMIICLIYTTNIIGLCFLGMEHSLQVLLALGVLLGMIIESKTGQVRPLFLLSIVIGPLIRYENLALSFPAILYLLGRQHAKSALIAGSTLIFELVSFSYFLYQLGLGILPNSVLSKAAFTYMNSGLLDKIIDVLTGPFSLIIDKPAALLLALLGVWLFALVLHSKTKPADRWIAATVTLAIVLHLLFGLFGWYSRYEIYIYIVSILTLFYLLRTFIKDWLNREKLPSSMLIILIFLTVGGLEYIWSTISIPYAANNVYEQQYQIHRFITQYYQKPIAVNDIGWSTYKNNDYVLDLWGLGSYEALKNRRGNQDALWMDRMAKRHDIALAIIYKKAFNNIPENWQMVAQMHLSRQRITPLYGTVSFYLIDPSARDMVEARLKTFKQTLPKRVKLVIQ